MWESVALNWVKVLLLLVIYRHLYKFQSVFYRKKKPHRGFRKIWNLIDTWVKREYFSEFAGFFFLEMNEEFNVL